MDCRQKLQGLFQDLKPLTRTQQKILVFNYFFRMRKVRGDSVSNQIMLNRLHTQLEENLQRNGSRGSVAFTCAGTNETFTSIASLKNYTLIVNTGAFNY
nr:MAG: hypothetical protein CM15mV30_1620 [uncultured marine virus]